MGTSDPLTEQVVRLRLRRQAPGEEQAYQLEIKFPTKDTDEVTNGQGQQERIERLIQSIILEQNKLAVNDKLPNTILDKTSVAVQQSFTCPDGDVVSDTECVACPTGRVTETMSSTSAADCKISCYVVMYYDKIELKHCRPCGYGKYQPDEGKFSCRLCG